MCAARPPPNAVVCPNDQQVLVPAEADPLVGQLVGNYKVLKRLGIGGMGAVYEGVEANIDKRAALKIVHPHLSADPRLPSLLAEAKAVNAIGDEGIVDIYGFGTLPDGRSYLVMELLEGEGLDARLAREKKLSVADTIELLLPLLQALEAAHAAGFVHRDLKTANVFIVKRPNRAPFPKLLDFGIAKQIKVPAREALGTADYVAPEQALNKNVGAKADLYSLGCLLFEVLTGQLPFRDRDPDEVVRLHREAPRPSLKALVPVPDALDELVRALMSVDPAGRPASAATVRAALLAIREQLQAPPEVVPTPKRWPFALGGLAVVGLLGFFALRPSATVEVPVPDDPVTVAAKRTAAELEQELTRAPLTALEGLLAAESSFPGRPEWQALRGQVNSALRREAAAALKKDDADGATKLLAALGRLGPLPKDDQLERATQRLSFAQHNGMVHVGEVFIDRYEYPNRAGVVPATRVDWADAVKLCEGAGKHLCTEAEWEAACRGEAALAYPWGAELEKGRCVTKEKKVKGPAASGSHPKCVGPAGVFDLTGNVAEWTATPVREGAPQRVTRGGSFVQSDARLACDARDYFLPGQGGAAHLGLRCCL